MRGKADDELDALKADYEQLRSQLPAALIELEWPSLGLSYLNAIAQTLLGYTETDVEAGIHGLALVDPPSQARLLASAQEQLADTVANGLPHVRMKGQRVYLVTAVRKDGTTFPGELQSAWILDREGFPRGVRFLFWDISDRKQLEAEKQELERQVRQSQKLDSLGQLAGGIAHDFNNILTVISGNLYLLRQAGAGDGTRDELIDETATVVERAAQVVRALLDFARPEIDEPRTIDLYELAAETVRFMAPLLRGHVVDLRKPSRPVNAVGNRTSLQQVVMNLLTNARDATPRGGTITIQLRTMRATRESRWLPPDLARGSYSTIDVADTGHEIPVELQERIFDPFFTTKSRGSGTGLGLTTSLGIARAHGGWLSCESSSPAGTTFRLVLPRLKSGPG